MNMLERKEELEQLQEKYKAMVEHWQKKQAEANQQASEWLTKLFAVKERLSEVSRWIQKEDVDNLDDED